MWSAVGFAVLGYSVAAVGLGFALMMASLAWPGLRALALRLMVVFGMFAGAGGYVWLWAGPEADMRLDVRDVPHWQRAQPSEIEI